MENSKVKALTNKELHATLREERQQLQKLKFNHAVAQIENPSKITQARKTVARLLTEINSRNNQVTDKID